MNAARLTNAPSYERSNLIKEPEHEFASRLATSLSDPPHVLSTPLHAT